MLLRCLSPFANYAKNKKVRLRPPQETTYQSHKSKPFYRQVQMDLRDFRNLLCECHSRHLWVLHVVDHYTKFSWLFALRDEQTEEVAGALTNLFWLFGFPSVIKTTTDLIMPLLFVASLNSPFTITFYINTEKHPQLFKESHSSHSKNL